MKAYFEHFYNFTGPTTHTLLKTLTEMQFLNISQHVLLLPSKKKKKLISKKL